MMSSNEPSSGPLNLEQIRRMREARAAADAEAAAAKKKNRRPDRDPAQATQDVSPAESHSPTATASDSMGDQPVMADAAEVSASSQGTSESATSTAPLVSVSTGEGAMASAAAESTSSAGSVSGDKERPPRDRSRRRDPRKGDDESYTASPAVVMPKVQPPSIRQPLASDLEDEFNSVLAGADLNSLMIGSPTLAVGRSIEEGSRHQGRVIKVHQDNVFVSLGGPDEGVVPLMQFNDMPQVGAMIDCLVRTFNVDDGLYELALPGEATAVEDWSDIQEGMVVDATVESCNTGGLECKVGGIRGFIPMRQISEFRVENPEEYVGKHLVCVVTEANPQRGNLVLSHRAIMERERQEKRAERFAALEVGQATEGVVRKIMDFGAFIDIGGLDGLLHISQLSYERVKHPSEILKEGDTIQVRVEKIDRDTAKSVCPIVASRNIPGPRSMRSSRSARW